MDEEFYGTNSTHNSSNCKDGYCVESTIYIKVMGTFIFVLVWPFIVLDIKWLPLGRPAAALMGGALMVIFVVVPQDQVYVILGGTGNIQTLFLLIGMMLMSYYYDREGILQYITLWIFGKNKPFKSVLWKVCVLCAVLSAIITNDATCLVLTPLLMAEHMKQGRPRSEYSPLLLGIATSANIGSSSTFFGNPQNAFIAANSKGQVSLIIFLITTLPAAIIGIVISTSLLYLCYFRVIWPKRELLTQLPSDTKMNGNANGVIKVNPVGGGESKDLPLPMSNGLIRSENNPYDAVLSRSREELALSYDKSINPYITSQMSEERNKMYSTSKEISTKANQRNNSFLAYSHKVSSAEDGTASTNESKSSSPEYGAVGKNYYENHIHNHIASGRVSRLQLRNSDRFGSSMCMSECRPLSKENSEESTLVAGEMNSPKSSIGTSEISSNGINRRKWIFVAWLAFITFVLVTLLAVPPPPTVPVGFNLGLVPLGAGIITMFVDTIVNRKYAFDAIMKVDWTMILMFMGLFIWLGGFENTLFPSMAFQFLSKHMDLYRIEGVVLFTLFVVVGSNVLSNVPLVILIVDQLFSFKCGENLCTGQLTGVLLAGISTIAGNFTLVGSVANLIVAEKARNISNYRLGFFEYLKFGFCSTTIVLIAGIPIMYFAGDKVRI